MTNIHTEEELARYICDEVQSKPIDLKNVAAFKIWFIPNYKPDESVILFMGHHSLLDGVQFFSAMQTLDKDSDFSKLQRVTPPTWW